MFTAQVDLCKQLVADLEPMSGDTKLILAAALARAGRHSQAVEELLAVGLDPVTLLTAGQVMLNAGETQEAVALRGAAKALITLHHALNQQAEAAR
jgi:hypothetical protein